MADILISVRGEAERRLSPELATVRASAVAEGRHRDAVVERATSAAASLRAYLTAAVDAGTVAEWSSGTTSVWSDRPWAPDGQERARVHHASIEVEATFADLSAVSEWVGALADNDDVRVSHVDWQLTPETRVTAEREVATEAIDVAVVRATAYAAALGRATVEPAEIADAGLLGAGAQPGGSGPLFARAALMSADASGGGFDLRPADIVVSAAVDGRFTAR